MIKVSTDKAPKAIGPYSQAIKSGSLVFTSGQIPLDPKSGEIVGADIVAQANQTLNNLKAVLEASGSGMEYIVKTTCFLADMCYFQKFNEVYSNYIVNAPARSCVAVKTLPKNVLCEVEAIAELK